MRRHQQLYGPRDLELGTSGTGGRAGLERLASGADVAKIQGPHPVANAAVLLLEHGGDDDENVMMLAMSYSMTDSYSRI